jgi:hypothetical protein
VGDEFKRSREERDVGMLTGWDFVDRCFGVEDPVSSSFGVNGGGACKLTLRGLSRDGDTSPEWLDDEEASTEG